MNQLRVDQNTTAEQLQPFAEQAGDKDKIRGKRNEDGSITLYSSPKRDGLKDLFFDRRANRREAAREGLSTVLSKVGDPKTLNRDHLSMVQKLVANAMSKLPTGELRGANLKELAAKLATVKEDALPEVKARQMHKLFEREMKIHENWSQVKGGEKRAALREDIKGFDRANLKPSLTTETTGLVQAKEQMQVDSLSDKLVRGDAPEKMHEPAPLLGEPRLSQLSGKVLTSDALSELAGRMQELKSNSNASMLKDFATELGNLVASDLRGASHDVQMAFAISHGDQFKAELYGALAEKAGHKEPFNSDYEHASSEIKKVIDDAFTHAMAHLPDRHVDEKTVTINGTTYTFAKQLAVGGYGKADLYQSANGEQIVLKSPIYKQQEIGGSAAIKEKADKFSEAANEVRAHRSATGQGHPNVVGLKGAVRTADGRLLIALDFAPRGDVNGFIKKLNEAVKKGEVSQHAANLVRATLLKDMIKGMQHVQENRGMIHLDLKPANYFIGADGAALVGDFGTAATGLKRKLAKPLVDNFRWLAPEASKGQRHLAGLLEKAMDANEQAYYGAMEKSDKQLEQHKNNVPQDVFSKMGRQAKQELVKFRQKLEGALDRFMGANAITLTEKVDTWSLGISAYEMFYGDVPFEGQFGEGQDKVEAFGANVENRVRGLGTDAKGEKTGSGVTSLDRLLNQMIRPDPKQRPTLTEALSSSLFLQGGVDSDEVRDLIKALTDNPTSTAKIKSASDKLGV